MPPYRGAPAEVEVSLDGHTMTIKDDDGDVLEVSKATSVVAECYGGGVAFYFRTTSNLDSLGDVSHKGPQVRVDRAALTAMLEMMHRIIKDAE